MEEVPTPIEFADIKHLFTIFCEERSYETYCEGFPDRCDHRGSDGTNPINVFEQGDGEGADDYHCNVDGDGLLYTLETWLAIHFELSCTMVKGDTQLFQWGRGSLTPAAETMFFRANILTLNPPVASMLA